MKNRTTTLRMELGERSYDINIGTGILACADKYINLSRKILIVTDSGVPIEYANTVAALCHDAKILVIDEGEENKRLSSFERVCAQMLDFGMQRKDAVIAVGGGVVGDITGFAASAYMRGIDFYNIPTTLLSQVDSSIGGKTAVDFMGVKNIIGAFYQPKAVLIDTEVLKTLEPRQFSAGLAEVVKMALTSDAELFELIENGLWKNDLITLITRALMIKKAVVEADEREGALRKILNFGHTFGHGIESLGGLYHGECVALGMLPMSSEEVKERLIPILCEMGLPVRFEGDIDKALDFMRHDKKGDGDFTHAVFVDKVGSFRLEKISFDALCRHIKENI